MRPLILSILLLCSTKAVAQTTIISSAFNLAYIGLPNPITIVSDHYKTKKLILHTDNGSLNQHEASEYTWTPGSSKYGTLSLYRKSGKDSTLVYSRRFRLISFEFNFQIGNQKDSISIDRLLKLKKASLFQPEGFAIDIRNPTPKEYKIVAARNSEILFTISNSGAEFSEGAMKEMADLKPKDVLTFYDIQFIGIDGKLHRADPVEYVITDLPVLPR